MTKALHRIDEEEPDESVCGPGSSLRYTKRFRKGLESFLNRSVESSLFDAPCGDFHWMKAVKLPARMRYIGADVNDALVEANQLNHAKRDREFLAVDLLAGEFKDADIWLCRDLMFLLSFENVHRLIEISVRHPFKYYLLTSHRNEKNVDAADGEYRELNLQAEPFNLPEPIDKIEDWIEGYPSRYVGVWTRDQLLERLYGSIAQ